MFKPQMTDDEKKAIEESFNHRSADVDRCWIKYALNLMSDSRERLMAEAEEDGLPGKWNKVFKHFRRVTMSICISSHRRRKYRRLFNIQLFA